MNGTYITHDTRAMSHETVDKQKRYNQILAVLSEKPKTAKECAHELWALGVLPSDDRNYTAPRLTELSKLGIVEPVGKKKCDFTGKTVAVYAIRRGEENDEV